jgi:hypothetical protein
MNDGPMETTKVGRYLHSPDDQLLQRVHGPIGQRNEYKLLHTPDNNFDIQTTVLNCKGYIETLRFAKATRFLVYKWGYIKITSA